MNKSNETKHYTFKCLHCGETVSFGVSGKDYARIISCNKCGNLTPLPKTTIESIEKDLYEQSLLNGPIEYDRNEFEIVDTKLIKYIGSKKDISIPVGVTIIGKRAFSGSNIKSVVMPDSIVEVENEAFSCCRKLTQVKLGCSIKKINPEVFAYCNSLLDIVIPDNVEEIDGDAFRECTKLESIVIGKGVKQIVKHAFDGCNGLQTVFWNATDCEGQFDQFYKSYESSIKNLIIGSDVKKLPFHYLLVSECIENVYYSGDIAGWLNIAFDYRPLRNGANLYIDNELVKEVIIPQTVAEIKNSVFCGYKNLTSLILHDAIKMIGAEAFASTNIKSFVVPAGVIEVSDSICEGCANLENLTLHNEITSIGSKAFLDTNIKNIVLPGKVSYIGEKAFCGCNGITNIELNENITFIGYDAFSCPNLGTVHWNITRLTSSNKIFGEGLKNLVIGENVTAIPAKAFSQCYQLRNFELGKNVAYIGEEAFESCGIVKLELGNSVLKIGEKAFSDCRDLETVSLGNNIIEIGMLAFSSCDKLTKIRLPKRIQEIGTGAFSCSNLRHVEVPIRFAGKLNKFQKEMIFDDYRLDEIKFTLVL